LVAIATSLERSRSFICTQYAFSEKIAKIGPANLEIIVYREIILKRRKKERNYGR